MFLTYSKGLLRAVPTAEAGARSAAVVSLSITQECKSKETGR